MQASLHQAGIKSSNINTLKQLTGYFKK